MKRRVVVTGIGAVTSLSCKVDDLWKKILAGESGVHTLRHFDTSGFKVGIAGDVYDWAIPEDYLSAKEAKRIDRFAQLRQVIKGYCRKHMMFNVVLHVPIVKCR